MQLQDDPDFDETIEDDIIDADKNSDDDQEEKQEHDHDHKEE